MTIIRSITRLGNVFRGDFAEPRFFEVVNEFTEQESNQIFAIAKKHKMNKEVIRIRPEEIEKTKEDA